MRQQRHTGEATRGGETILVLDDEAAVRELARRVLEPLGYVVLEAPDARNESAFFSGDSEEAEEVSDARDDGHAFIRKPFSPDQLAREVRQLLG